MVGRPKVGIGKPRTGTDDDHRRLVVTGINPDLLVTPRRRKRGNRINDGAKTGERHAGSDTHHVRFGYAAVEESSFVVLLELIEQLVTDIPG